MIAIAERAPLGGDIGDTIKRGCRKAMADLNLVAVDGEEVELSMNTCYLMVIDGATLSINFTTPHSHLTVDLTFDDLKRLAGFLNEMVESINS